MLGENAAEGALIATGADWSVAAHPLFDTEFVAAVLDLPALPPQEVAARYRLVGADGLAPFHPLLDVSSLPEVIRVLLQTGDLLAVLRWLETDEARGVPWGFPWHAREQLAPSSANGAEGHPTRGGQQSRGRSLEAREVARLSPTDPLPYGDVDLTWGRIRASMTSIARQSRRSDGVARPRDVFDFDRRSNSTLVVVIDRGARPERLIRAIRSALAGPSDRSIRVVLVVHPNRDLSGALAVASLGGYESVRVVRHESLSGVSDQEASDALSDYAAIVIADPDLVWRDSAVEMLVDALDEPAVSGSQPVISASDGTLIAAGLEVIPGTSHRAPFLEGLSPDDLPASERRVARGFAPGAVAFRPSETNFGMWWGAIVQAEPFATSIGDALARQGSLVVVLGSRTVLTSDVEVRLASVPPVQDEGSADWLPQRQPLPWRAAGWDVAYVAPPTNESDRPRPILTRPEGHPFRGRMRWAIKVGAAYSRSGDRWGDVPFAADLARALRAEGCDAVVDRFHPGARRWSYLDDVVLVLRGRHPITPVPGRRNILWIISRPELVDVREFDGFDVIVASSAPWAARASALSGRRVEVLLQAAADRFRPSSRAQRFAAGALFVGGARPPHGRQVVADARGAGLPLELWGPNWHEFGFTDYHAGEYLENGELPSRYAAAAVVLSDHFPEMAKEGFINNRVFEAVAAGARVISDKVEGIEELFGGAVRTYSTLEELEHLWRDRDRLFPSARDRRRIAARVQRDHSFRARARRLVALADDVRASTA